jgi:flagellin-specific chaperone FliS
MSAYTLSRKTPMTKNSEFSYLKEEFDPERKQKIISILSDGVYKYLKKTGRLKENPNQSEKIKLLIEKAREITRKNTEDSEIDSLDSS